MAFRLGGEGRRLGSGYQQRTYALVSTASQPALQIRHHDQLPPLAFEDRYFDFIYAGSVFTHIADLAEAWLMELRRIVRPGGRLYLTIQDERSIELCMTANHNPPVAELLRAYDEESHFMSTGYDFFTINRTPGQGGPGQAQVFYRRDYRSEERRVGKE